MVERIMIPLVGSRIPAECNTLEHKKDKRNERAKVDGKKLGTGWSGVDGRFCNHRRAKPEDIDKASPASGEPSQPPVQTHAIAHYQQDLRGEKQQALARFENRRSSDWTDQFGSDSSHLSLYRYSVVASETGVSANRTAARPGCSSSQNARRCIQKSAGT